MALGVCVIILPFLGFPGFWERVLILAAGVIIVGIAYSMGSEKRPAIASNIPYVEHKNDPVASKTVPVAEVPPLPAVHN